VLFGSYLNEDEEGVVLAIAHFRGQPNLCEALDELLKGSNCSLLVCFQSTICLFRETTHPHTGVCKAEADHVVDIHVCLDCRLLWAFGGHDEDSGRLQLD
jgi:hypothetical protein